MIEVQDLYSGYLIEAHDGFMVVSMTLRLMLDTLGAAVTVKASTIS